MITMEFIFYLVIILAVVAYAVLDGFDLGVGILHPFAKDDHEKRIFLNAIGPVWDGNEVWLIIVVGGLLAGFPDVYATLLSNFYLPVMALLMGLIFRAVSIEFRSKRPSKAWRKIWDAVFFFGSLVIAFGVGIVLGNLITGIPLDSNRVLVGNLGEFFHSYQVAVGLMTISLFIMHGAIYLVMKTEGELHDRVRSWVPRLIGLFITLYAIVTAWTIEKLPYMVEPMLKYPILFLVPIAALFAIFFVPYLMKKRSDGWAFIFSCVSIALLLSLAAIGTFPNMIRSSIDTETNSLLLTNSSSSETTLGILLVIVAIGIPLVLSYGYFLYRTFRGKVEINETSY